MMPAMDAVASASGASAAVPMALLETIHWKDKDSIESSTFSGRRPTFVVVHGFRGSVKKTWMREMCDAVLRLDDYNCIIVGWGGGARTLNYFQVREMCDAVLRLDDYNCIIVGWGGGARTLNYFQVREMCDAMLRLDDYNCIIVGWGGGARTLNYFQVSGCVN